MLLTMLRYAVESDFIVRVFFHGEPQDWY